MKGYRMLLGVMMAAQLGCPIVAWAGSAEQVFTEGKALLTKGDLEGALKAYATAARSDPSKREYLQQYALLRQVIELHNRLPVERDPQQWEYLARALHSFYVDQGIYSEALKVSQQAHARLKTASSAAMLAETALAMDQDEVAAQSLAGLDSGQTTPATQALLGIALARQGKLDQAKQIARSMQMSAATEAPVLYAVARLRAATGDATAALGSLRRCFESLPPSRLEGFKQHARQCAEFSGLVATTGFAAVLQTQSKVSESKCSGGSGCANCPMRGKCAKSQNQ